MKDINKVSFFSLWVAAAISLAAPVLAESGRGLRNGEQHRGAAYFVLQHILNADSDSDSALKGTKSFIEEGEIESVVFLVSEDVARSEPPAPHHSVVLLYDVATEEKIEIEESLESFQDRNGSFHAWEWNKGEHVVIWLWPTPEEGEATYRYRFGFGDCNSRNGNISRNDQDTLIFGSSRFMCCF